MEKDFWFERWANNEIAFHESAANPMLVAHFTKLTLAAGSRVFVPLCGKTLDIGWLLAHGYKVVGIELVKSAIEQLFMELGMEPDISEAGNLLRYSAQDIDIFVGDIFDLSITEFGQVDAIYDRAALVALPPAMRERYTAHLTQITNSAPQLLLCFEYDQQLMEGPPFAVLPEEVEQHYGAVYTVNLLESVQMSDGLKGFSPVMENVWLLENKQ